MNLPIELILQRVDETLYSQYGTAKTNIVQKIMRFGNSNFPGGNDHGPHHIERILEYLGKFIGENAVQRGVMNPLELYLTMLSVLYHDIAMLRGRENHPEKAADYLLSSSDTERIFSEDPNGFLFENTEREIIAGAVLSHGGKADIGDVFRRLGDRKIINGYTVRPKMIAALLRFCDELDEDQRRAPRRAEAIATPPENSLFHWRFCQRISGIHPDILAKTIRIDASFERNDIGYEVRVGGMPRLFLAAFGEKLAKINSERQNVNRFLPEEFRYERLEVSVTPFLDHKTWRDPRTFTFTDNISGYQFVNAFPELLTEQPNASLYTVLLLIGTKRYRDAKMELEYLNQVEGNRPDYQFRISYNLACVESRIAHSSGDAAEQRNALDRAVGHLERWIHSGITGGWQSDGRTAPNEIHKMTVDDDLFFLLHSREAEILRIIPEELRTSFKVPPTPSGRSGCVILGTPIRTLDGTVLAEEIRAGMRIVSIDVEKDRRIIPTRITAVRSFRLPVCIRINDRLTASRMQPVLERRQGWIKCEDLALGMEILTEDSNFETVRNISSLQGYFEVFIFETSHPSHNFVADGIVCHNEKF